MCTCYRFWMRHCCFLRRESPWIERYEPLMVALMCCLMSACFAHISSDLPTWRRIMLTSSGPLVTCLIVLMIELQFSGYGSGRWYRINLHRLKFWGCAALLSLILLSGVGIAVQLF